MTKIKLADGTIINAESIELVNGALKITTHEKTVEELAEIFSDKEKTSLITLMTESEKETGHKAGFTSFSGINYNSEGVKIVELFQPVDVTEARISKAEGNANLANEGVSQANEDISELEATVDALLGTEKETEVEADE